MGPHGILHPEHDAQYLAIRSKCLNHNMQSRHITAPFGCNMSCYIQKKAGNQSMPTENALLGSFDTCDDPQGAEGKGIAGDVLA